MRFLRHLGSYRSEVGPWGKLRLLRARFKRPPPPPVSEDSPASPSPMPHCSMLEGFAWSDKGCVREHNEDYCLIEPGLGLYALADGMGGAQAGELAARLAAETVAERLLLATTRDAQVLLAAVEEANRKVMEVASGDPTLEGMGSTLVAAFEVGEEICIASVGDSRAYLLDDTGFRAITEDQSWINHVGRPLGLDEDSLRTHPMRHVLTMAIGATSPLTINSYALRLNPSALLLMCSDGLHGVVQHSEIEEILRDGAGADGLQGKCLRLIEAARGAGGPDNITAILVRVKPNLSGSGSTCANL